MGKAIRRVRGESQKNIIRLLDGISGRYSRWEVWQDFIIMSAISLANTVDGPYREEREKAYLERARKYSKRELAAFPEMLAEIVMDMERNPDQDFLGELFMALDLGNEWKGQFFTPYDVCRMMASMTYESDMQHRVDRDGWISVNDPACGAGALLIAFANECQRKGINYQTSVLFVAQDVDFLAGCMCYIQLSLMGCPGYVVIDNTLTHPSTCYAVCFPMVVQTYGTPLCIPVTFGITAEFGQRWTPSFSLRPFPRTPPRKRRLLRGLS